MVQSKLVNLVVNIHVQNVFIAIFLSLPVLTVYITFPRSMLKHDIPLNEY